MHDILYKISTTTHHVISLARTGHTRVHGRLDPDVASLHVQPSRVTLRYDSHPTPTFRFEQPWQAQVKDDREACRTDRSRRWTNTHLNNGRRSATKAPNAPASFHPLCQLGSRRPHYPRTLTRRRSQPSIRASRLSEEGVVGRCCVYHPSARGTLC